MVASWRLRFRINRTTSEEDVGGAVCYRPPDQEERLPSDSWKKCHICRPLPAKGFNHIGICWSTVLCTGENRLFKRILEWIHGKFLLAEEQKRGRVLLTSYLETMKNWLEVWLGGRLGCNDHEMVELRILEEKQDKKWDHSPRFQGRRLWPIQAKTCLEESHDMGQSHNEDGPRRPGLGELAWESSRLVYLHLQESTLSSVFILRLPGKKCFLDYV